MLILYILNELIVNNILFINREEFKCDSYLCFVDESSRSHMQLTDPWV